MGGEGLYPGLTRKFGFAAWLLYWAWLQLGANDCLICSLLQVISPIHYGQAGPRVAAGKSIRIKNIRDPEKVWLKFCTLVWVSECVSLWLCVMQSLETEEVKVNRSDYSKRRKEQGSSSFVYNIKAHGLRLGTCSTEGWSGVSHAQLSWG